MTLTEFVKGMTIFPILIIILIFGLFAYLAINSLEKLPPKYSLYYDFGKFFPHSGSWAFVIYLIFLFIMGIFIFLYAKYGLNIFPA